MIELNNVYNRTTIVHNRTRLRQPSQAYRESERERERERERKREEERERGERERQISDRGHSCHGLTRTEAEMRRELPRFTEIRGDMCGDSLGDSLE
jgi:hypothetical protein